MSVLKIDTPRIYTPLLEPARHKGAKGGRGSGKSHFFAESLIEDALRFPGEAGEGLRGVCIREVQKDLKESAKLLLEDKIAKYRPSGFKPFTDRIETPGDGVIIFRGMQDYNSESIKSLEGFHRAWVEEAHTLSDRSLTLLRPTIRWEDEQRGLSSELWYSWNPRRKTDPVDAMFAKGGPNVLCVTANWRDNPWFPKVLEKERLDDLENRPDQYNHIWEGDYVTVVDGAYYAKQLTAARQEKRIGRVAADPLMTYRAIWDIGGTGMKADATAIWIAQYVGKEIRWLDYYEAVGQPLSSHINWLREKRPGLEQGYSGALCVLPHDAENHGPLSIYNFKDHIEQAGFPTRVIENQGKGAAIQRIEAARRLFPRMWFNEETTQPGLDALGWYHEKKDEARNVGLGPEHDWSSHGADAFGLGSIDYEEPVTKAQNYRRANKGWIV